MQCFHPIMLRGPDYTGPVPCGKCFACQSNRRRDWHMRIKYELLHNVCSYTVTLTYDNEHLPKAILYKKEDLDMTMTGYKELDDVQFEHFMDTVGFYYHPYDITHIQKFFKRLRKAGLEFRYFGVAEYGSKSNRPHYHIIFFFDKYVSKVRFQTLVVNQWPYGCQIVIDETNDDCIGYTLKYCLKFFNSNQPQPKIFLSKRPFIGNGYLTNETVNYLRSKPGDIVRTVSGVQRLPRIIRNKVYDDNMLEVNKDVIHEYIDEQIVIDSRIADSLGLTLEEYHRRKREAFTEKCVKSLKKKKL